MNTKFRIGKDVHGEVFDIDLPTLIDGRCLVAGSSGSGKTYLIRRIVECVANKVQVIILDPEGHLNTLREKFDMIIVGEEGDIPATVETAGLLARKLVEENVSAIIDLSDMHISRGESVWDKRRAYCAEFVETLMDLPKRLYKPLLLVIDEAHEFAPESTKGASEEKEASLAAIRHLMSQGRKRGYGGILATQRISKIDKDAIADARNIMVGYANLDLDVARCGEMLGLTKSEAMATLRQMPAGQFYMYGPAVKKGTTLFNCDESITTHPRPGQWEGIQVPRPGKGVLDALKKIGDVPTQVKEKKDRMEELEKENFQLKRAMDERPVQVKAEEKIVEVEVPMISEGDIALLSVKAETMEELYRNLVEKSDALMETAKDALAFSQGLEATARIKANGHRPVSIGVDWAEKRDPVRTLPTHERVATPEKPAGKHDLSKAGRSILTALAWYGPLVKDALAVRALYSPGGGFNNGLIELRGKGYINTGSPVTATPEGMAAYKRGEFEELPTGKSLVEAWRKKLDKAGREMLGVLYPRYPNPVPRAELIEQAGYMEGGGANNGIIQLCSWGLAERVKLANGAAVRATWAVSEARR